MSKKGKKKVKEEKQQLVRRKTECTCTVRESETFDWIKGKEVVASITIYEDGLVEFSGGKGKSVSIEQVGTDEQRVYADVPKGQQILVDGKEVVIGPAKIVA
jgi:hypothetical protein